MYDGMKLIATYCSSQKNYFLKVPIDVKQEMFDLTRCSKSISNMFLISLRFQI